MDEDKNVIKSERKIETEIKTIDKDSKVELINQLATLCSEQELKLSLAKLQIICNIDAEITRLNMEKEAILNESNI